MLKVDLLEEDINERINNMYYKFLEFYSSNPKAGAFIIIMVSLMFIERCGDKLFNLLFTYWCEKRLIRIFEKERKEKIRQSRKSFDFELYCKKLKRKEQSKKNRNKDASKNRKNIGNISNGE